MRYFSLRKLSWFVIIVVMLFSQFIPPPIVVDAQVRTCAVEWYDTSSIPYIFSHNERNVGLCNRTDTITTCGVGAVFAGSINTNDIWCAGSGVPDPPPNLPGISAGAACQAGSSRTVSITPTGDTHDIQISPSNQIVALAGNSYTFTNLQQGVSYQFQARAENSGGSSDWSNWTGVVEQDLTAPTTTLDLVGTMGLNSWWQSAVSVSLPATDSGCLGVSNTLYTLDSVANTYTGSAFNIPTEGTHTLSYYSTDGSYSEPVQNAIILIDTVAPSLTLIPDRLPDGSAGWWIAPVTVSLSANDSASGVSSLDSNLNSAGWTNYINPIALTVDGTYSLDGRAIDVSGWETVDGLVLPLDSTAPTVGFTFSRPPDHNGWYTGAVDVGVTSSDATSGLAGTIARLRSEGTWQAYTGVYTLNSDAQHIFEAIATDIASNATAQEVTIPMDFTAPYLEFVFSREPDRNGWYNDSVHVAILSGDATSGIALVQARLVYEGIWRDYQGAYLIGGNGEHIFEAEVTDYAGHFITGQTIVPIDITAPVTTLIWDGQTLDFTVSDNRSGVMGTTVTINGVVTRYIGEAIEFEIAGDYRIEVYSTDMAGNDEAVQVLNISYDPSAETVLVPLTSPTLSADMSCTDDSYSISGFASASAGLSSIYLVADDNIVTGGRYDYSPASTELEAFAFYYSISEDENPELSVVALADDGSERRLSLSCPADSILLLPIGFANDDFYNRLLRLNPIDDPQGVNSEELVTELVDETVSASLNQYPTSLGDNSTTLEEVDTNETQDPVPASASAQQQATSNTNSGSNPAPMPVIDTTVTVLEPSSPELTYVTGKASSLSAEDLAKILAATGLLATATAGVGLQVTETARRRKEELEEEYIAEQARLEKERIAQAERARENVEMNAQMREDAQKEVFIDVQVSEAYKEWEKHVAALWAEYHTRTERGQRINASHAINQQVQALIDGVDSAMSQYGSFMTADEMAQLQAQIDTYNASFSDFQPNAMLEQVQGLNELYAPIMTNVQGRYSAWQQAQIVQQQEQQQQILAYMGLNNAAYWVRQNILQPISGLLGTFGLNIDPSFFVQNDLDNIEVTNYNPDDYQAIPEDPLTRIRNGGIDRTSVYLLDLEEFGNTPSEEIRRHFINQGLDQFGTVIYSIPGFTATRGVRVVTALNQADVLDREFGYRWNEEPPAIVSVHFDATNYHWSMIDLLPDDGIGTYEQAQLNAVAAGEELAHWIDVNRQRNNSANINLYSHSMGGELLLSALAHLDDQTHVNTVSLHQAAPFVDDRFVDEHEHPEIFFGIFGQELNHPQGEYHRVLTEEVLVDGVLMPRVGYLIISSNSNDLGLRGTNNASDGDETHRSGQVFSNYAALGIHNAQDMANLEFFLARQNAGMPISLVDLAPYRDIQAIVTNGHSSPDPSGYRENGILTYVPYSFFVNTMSEIFPNIEPMISDKFVDQVNMIFTETDIGWDEESLPELWQDRALAITLSDLELDRYIASVVNGSIEFDEDTYAELVRNAITNVYFNEST